MMPDGSEGIPNKLNAALDYASRAIPVFPCDPDTKKPLTPNGFKNASTDPKVITGWWRHWPAAMLATPTGKISGCVVLDVDQDKEKGKDGEASLSALLEREGPLPETAVQVTPRGGRHFFFAHPGHKVKNSADEIGNGLDVRGDGGYIILAPSSRPDGGAYRWLRDPKDVDLAPIPEWLLNLVAPSEPGKRKKRNGRSQYADAALNAEVEKVRAARVGQRNDILNTAAFNLGQLVGSGLLDRAEVEMALRAAASSLIADDGADTVEATIASGITSGMAQPREPKKKPHTLPRDWYADCIVGAEGQVLGNIANALLALRSDPAWQGVLSYDEMLRTAILQQPVARHGPPRPTEVSKPRPVCDEDVAAAQEWLQIAGIPTVGKDTTHSAVDLVARENSFHPVRDYLDWLAWDRVERLPSWLHKYLGADNCPYATEVGKMFLISMVVRIYQPGCKLDYMLILQGGQGAKKSSACQILAGDWFSDNMTENLASKDASQHIRGKWLIELAELHALGRSETTALKSFLTRRTEIYRPSYGRKEVHEPRQVAFIGTTNKATYLRDETGGRRFWPITVGKIDLDQLQKDRDQLFAEAMHRYRKGEHWWPDAEFEREQIAPQQEARYEADAWEDLIVAYLDNEVKETPDHPKGEKVTVHQVARSALFVQTDKLGTTEQRRISAGLERAGWERGPRGNKGERWWVPTPRYRAEKEAQKEADNKRRAANVA
jgi:hypothetical protein